jgi:hypothetical protein
MGSARLMLPRFRPPICICPRLRAAGSKLLEDRVSLVCITLLREDGYVLGVVDDLEVDAFLAILYLDYIIGVDVPVLVVGRVALLDLSGVALLGITRVALLVTTFLSGQGQASEEKDCE